MTQKDIFKRALALLALLVPIGIALAVTSYPLKDKIQMRLGNEMSARGLSSASVVISHLDNRNITFSLIRFTKEKVTVEVRDLNITATNLPYNELLRNNYTNLAASWSIGALTIDGLPQQLPELEGEGVYYMKDQVPTLTGDLHDAKYTHATTFTVTPKTVLLENTKMQWQGAKLTANEIVYWLQEKKPTLIPLKMQNLPLDTLLSMVASGKATGTGNVSGAADIIVYPDGRFAFSDGKFAAVAPGLIQISPSVLPGDQPQMEMARTALGNFHYNDLSISLDPAKDGAVTIRLTMGGNNPDAFDGKPVKLNVNLSGDVLELLQQIILPLADPSKYLEKE